MVRSSAANGLNGVTPDIGSDLKRNGGREPEDHGRIVNGEFVKDKGLNWFVAALFLVGDMAGGGIVALPIAVLQCGFITGVILCVVMACVATASAIFLGRSWETLPRRWPIYRSHCRKPYAEIGYRALGEKTRTFVSLCLNITQFGICVVFLLLASENIHNFIYTFWHGVPSVCIIILVVAVLLLPITFLKSPEDFWWAVVAGMFSTAVAVVLILVGTARDTPVCSKVRQDPNFSVFNFLSALGTIVFTFGGHSAFPTIQHDMRRPAQFGRSSVIAFITICIFYAPVVFLAYLTYGDSLRDSIIPSIQTTWIQQAVNMMIAAHCVLTLTLMINPLNQETEEYLQVPHHFGIKRVYVRTLMLAAITFMAETVPKFGPVLDLMGASTVTLTCVIFPCIFYMFIKANEKKSQQTGKDELVSVKEMISLTDRKVLVLGTFIIVVGVIGGACGTFSAIHKMTAVDFKMPCYLKTFFPGKEDTSPTSTNCCGAFQNTTVSGVAPKGYCNPPSLDYYGTR